MEQKYQHANTDIYVTLKRLCIFRIKGPDTNKDSPDDRASQNASAAVPQNSAPRKTSNILAEMVQPHRLFQSEFQISSILSHHTKTKQKIIQVSLRGLDNYRNCLRVTKDAITPDNRKQSGEHNIHIPKR